jgi:archaeoflavoprotein AfpA
MNKKALKRKVAWGITGSGDKLTETYDLMKKLNETYEDVDIEVFLSKAGQLVTKYYKLDGELKSQFSKVFIEKNANSPFLAARLQLGEFDFLLIAPATSNTVAKLAHGIGDTMLTNSALQALKAFVPVYIMPVDYREGVTVTKLPNGRELKIRVRKEDAENVKKLVSMEFVHTFETSNEISSLFKRYY